MSAVSKKFEILQQNLVTYDELWVAFSGGIDSTFLLHSAIEALGEDRVTAVYIISSLCSTASVENARDVAKKNFSPNLNLLEIEVHPLEWEEFVKNDARRCYYCKKRMYTALLAEMKKHGASYLADGTNLDDLGADRPGLLALEELNILTPLVEARLLKSEIRKLAQELGISNYGLFSNSCLATRIGTSEPIHSDSLRLVEEAEAVMIKLGYSGCRVRFVAERAIIEVRKEDLPAIFRNEMREKILRHMKDIGFTNISISLEGRE